MTLHWRTDLGARKILPDHRPDSLAEPGSSRVANGLGEIKSVAPLIRGTTLRCPCHTLGNGSARALA